MWYQTSHQKSIKRVRQVNGYRLLHGFPVIASCIRKNNCRIVRSPRHKNSTCHRGWWHFSFLWIQAWSATIWMQPIPVWIPFYAIWGIQERQQGNVSWFYPIQGHKTSGLKNSVHSDSWNHYERHKKKIWHVLNFFAKLWQLLYHQCIEKPATAVFLKLASALFLQWHS